MTNIKIRDKIYKDDKDSKGDKLGKGVFFKVLNFLDTSNFKTMQKSLDMMTQKMNLTAQNIANVNTPYYKSKKLEFENILQQKIDKINESYSLQLRYLGTDKKEKLQKYLGTSGDIEPVVVTDVTTEAKVDGNNVNIDNENLELAKIQLQYNYMVKKVTDEYNLLKHAISEGR